MKICLPSWSTFPVGYTWLPFSSVYTTGVTDLFVDIWSSTFTVIVRTSPSVLPDTIAVPSPTNLTSFAFFTVLEYSVAVTAPFSPVVLLEDTIQPILRKSPTVAAVLSLTFGAAPFVGLDKSTKPRFLSVVPSTLSPYVSNPDFTLPTVVGVFTVLPGLSFVFATFGFTTLVFTVVGVLPAFGSTVVVPSGFSVIVTASRGYTLPSFACT